MRLHIAEESGEALYCPECDRELWPAWWTEEGLEVGYWSDFAAPDGQAGLLVCGNLECTYEEAVTFVHSPVDAVVWNQEETHMVFTDHHWSRWPQTWLSEEIARIESLFNRTKQAKIRSVLELCRQDLDERKERIGRWLVEAEKGYLVTFHAEEEELKGRILASNNEELILQTEDGQVRVVPTKIIWEEHIKYPHKPHRPRRERRQGEEWVGFPLGDDRFMVVEGYHLRYGEPTDMGGFYRGRCWDPGAAAALRLREVAPGYWEGAFRAEEIERFYMRHDYVKFRGYWVEEVSRIEKHRLVWVKTVDPDVAQALDLEPQYQMEGGEFGTWDGDVIGYWDYVSLDEIEATRWEEEPEELPPDHR